MCEEEEEEAVTGTTKKVQVTKYLSVYTVATGEMVKTKKSELHLAPSKMEERRKTVKCSELIF